ncbi:hypothetical protein ACPA0F_08015 [Solibacillus silvestris]
MAQVEVMLHPQVHISKPTNYGGFKYFNALTIKNLTLTELAEQASMGKVFFPSVHSQAETISATTFAKQQLCLVDIDNSIENPYLFTEESIVALAKLFSLDVALIYRTQSYTPELPKFRVGFIADRVFTQYEGLLEDTHNALYKIINSVSTERLVDTSCNEPSRLFNGALYKSEPYVNEDAALFIAEVLIELTKELPEVPEEKKRVKKNGNKVFKKRSSNTTVSIEAIKAGNVDTFRTVFEENLLAASAQKEVHISNFAYKAITGDVEEAMKEVNMKDAYELFNHLPMTELFSLPNSTFNCVVHEDSKPSASILSEDIDMYKCFSSNCSCNEKAYTNFMLLLHFIGGKKKAFKFINALFKIKVSNVLTERVSQNIAFIESDKFKFACPIAYKLISSHGFKKKLYSTLEGVASVITPEQLTKKEDDCVFFYSMSEMEKLMEGTIACTSPDAVSQMMAFAALLGLINKRSDEELIDSTYIKLQEQRVRTAERTNQEASNVRRLSIYNVPLLSEVDLVQLEAISIKAKNGGISASKMSCNLVTQVFGEDMATLVYPTEKVTTISFKKHSEVIRVKKAIRVCLRKNKVVDKTAVKVNLGSMIAGMSRREFDDAYSIALAELGLRTEVVTNLHRELFAKDFPRNTRISFYPETIEEVINVEIETELEEMPVAVVSETSAFMETIIASLVEEVHQADAISISNIAVEVEEIPIISAEESNRSLKTELNRKIINKLNARMPKPEVNSILVEVCNEHSKLVCHQVVLLHQKQHLGESSSVTRRARANYSYDYIRRKSAKKEHPLAGGYSIHIVNQTTIGRLTL